jgi:Tfp pilus assembly protein PilO
MRLALFNNLTARNKLLIYLATAIVANAVIFYFILWPSVNQITTTRNDILNLKIDSENKITREKNINDLNGKIKKIEPQLEKINNTFVSQNRELEFITALEGLETKNNVKQNLNINLSNPEKGDVFSKVPVSIDVTGSFANLMNYLADIESLNYFINITSLSFKKVASDSEQNSRPADLSPAGKMTMSLSGYSYWK